MDDGRGIIADILDWDEAHEAYVAGEGTTEECYLRRLEAAGQMAKIEARWDHLPGGFHGERTRVKTHIKAIAESGEPMTSEERCWLAITAAWIWIVNSTSTPVGHEVTATNFTAPAPPS